MSWFTTFESILHIVEAAAKIAAPIVAVTVDPTIGALMLQATNAAVGAESIITTPGSGPQKAALVRAQTQATVDVINSILISQNKPPLAPNTTDIVQQQVRVVVSGLNTVQRAVEGGTAASAVTSR
jgi:hypothetical protein